MGLTVWFLERKIERTETSLAGIEERIQKVRKHADAGRITKAEMRDLIVDLETEAREKHAALAEALGELRRLKQGQRKIAVTP